MTKLSQSELNQFTGTECYYRHWLGHKYTDGVKFLAEKAGAYWLIDAVMSYQAKFKDIPFQDWELTVEEDKTAVLTMKEDSDKPELVRQRIPLTDFPMPYAELYFIDGVLLLPSEY